MISFFRSSSMVDLWALRGERRSRKEARRRGCPKTFLVLKSIPLWVEGGINPPPQSEAFTPHAPHPQTKQLAMAPPKAGLTAAPCRRSLLGLCEGSWPSRSLGALLPHSGLGPGTPAALLGQEGLGHRSRELGSARLGSRSRLGAVCGGGLVDLDGVGHPGATGAERETDSLQITGPPAGHAGATPSAAPGASCPSPCLAPDTRHLPLLGGEGRAPPQIQPWKNQAWSCYQGQVWPRGPRHSPRRSPLLKIRSPLARPPPQHPTGLQTHHVFRVLVMLGGAAAGSLTWPARRALGRCCFPPWQGRQRLSQRPWGSNSSSVCPSGQRARPPPPSCYGLRGGRGQREVRTQALGRAGRMWHRWHRCRCCWKPRPWPRALARHRQDRLGRRCGHWRRCWRVCCCWRSAPRPAGGGGVSHSDMKGGTQRASPRSPCLPWEVGLGSPAAPTGLASCFRKLLRIWRGLACAIAALAGQGEGSGGAAPLGPPGGRRLVCCFSRIPSLGWRAGLCSPLFLHHHPG